MNACCKLLVLALLFAGTTAARADPLQIPSCSGQETVTLVDKLAGQLQRDYLLRITLFQNYTFRSVEQLQSINYEDWASGTEDQRKVARSVDQQVASVQLQTSMHHALRSDIGAGIMFCSCQVTGSKDKQKKTLEYRVQYQGDLIYIEGGFRQ